MTRKFKITSLALLSIIILCTFLTAQSAHALATIRLDDGTTLLDVADGSALDSSGTVGTPDGVVTYNDNGLYYSYFSLVSVTTGVTYPVIGSLTSPDLHMDSIQVTGAGSIDVYFSEVGFGTTPLVTFESKTGGVPGGSVSANTYVDGGNSLFGTATTLASFGPSSVPFGGTQYYDFNPVDPYSLTTKASITHTAAYQTTSINVEVAVVPEPISSTLFIIGGATLGFRRFRKNRKV